MSDTTEHRQIRRQVWSFFFCQLIETTLGSFCQFGQLIRPENWKQNQYWTVALERPGSFQSQPKFVSNIYIMLPSISCRRALAELLRQQLGLFEKCQRILSTLLGAKKDNDLSISWSHEQVPHHVMSSIFQKYLTQEESTYSRGRVGGKGQQMG